MEVVMTAAAVDPRGGVSGMFSTLEGEGGEGGEGDPAIGSSAVNALDKYQSYRRPPQR